MLRVQRHANAADCNHSPSVNYKEYKEKGVLLVSAVSSALKGTRPKFKIATTSTTTTTDKPKQQPDNETAEGDEEIESTTSTDVNATTSHTLTGIPQIDYIWDPNLPRELNGYNLSDYPFYSTIPNLDEIDFKCDGLHDGFYASVPHKCQKTTG
ncbi:hypothetical protein PV325_006933 [Microctonus aethiopoides]|nr:hypothetical protein PV325_006933 [Microctonus aethiopoides]KAK0076115.1 hypothetical protein PV326_011053 [Microctonus aethiopoides]